MSQQVTNQQQQETPADGDLGTKLGNKVSGDWKEEDFWRGLRSLEKMGRATDGVHHSLAGSPTRAWFDQDGLWLNFCLALLT